MKFGRRQFLQAAGATAAFPVLSKIAKADGYPARPIHMILGFAPGSASDTVARLIAPMLSQRLGQQVIVENRTGAGSTLAGDVVSRAAPDGYTLLVMTITNAVNETLYQGLTYDFARDIVPVVGTFQSPNVLAVNPALPAKTLPEFIAYAKANPGKIDYASFGAGSAPHTNGELFDMMTGVKMVHVPYRGSPMPDLLSGQVQVIFSPMPVTIGAIRAGQLRALAVTTAKRSDALPGVPAMGEFVPGFDSSIWHGIGAPKGTPPEIIAKLNTEINAVLAEPKIKEMFAKYGGVPTGGPTDEFAKFVSEEVSKWAKVIKTANIKVEAEH
jgi:tripartite-type tricarboxylate transporter receptor subunit TctC